MKVAAILLMGGRGERCDPNCPKQYIHLGDKFLYQHALETVLASNLFDQVVVATGRPLEGYDVTQALAGPTRQQSSLAGIKACADEITHVVIHDSARPFVTEEILERNIEALRLHDAINTCIPSPDTINIASDGHVGRIIDRKRAFLGQTPQSFRKDLLLEAHAKTVKVDASDDCSLILELGHPVHYVLGDVKNFKITTLGDLDLALSSL